MWSARYGVGYGDGRYGTAYSTRRVSMVWGGQHGTAYGTHDVSMPPAVFNTKFFEWVQSRLGSWLETQARISL